MPPPLSGSSPRPTAVRRNPASRVQAPHKHATILTVPVLLLLVSVVILVGVVAVAIGRGGEMAEFAGDYPPLDTDDLLTAADVALLRPPSALWGYNAAATDQALGRIAQVVTERDVEIAALRKQLAEVRAATGYTTGSFGVVGSSGATGSSATGSSATGSPATGSPATGSPGTGSPGATGSSATGSSGATGSSATGSSGATGSFGAVAFGSAGPRSGPRSVSRPAPRSAPPSAPPPSPAPASPPTDTSTGDGGTGPDV